MKVRELIEKLQQMDGEADVWLPGTTPKGIPTYSLLDYVFIAPYSSISGDVYNTMDDVDMRLLDHWFEDNYNGNVVVMTSLFEDEVLKKKASNSETFSTDGNSDE